MSSAEMQELPEQGEIVIATVSKIMDHGAYVSLDEYGGIQGFLHISEIAPGWIRSVARRVKEGEKKVLLVKRVNPDRADIDLSLKQVSGDQKKKKLLDVKRDEKGRAFLDSVKQKAKLSESKLDELEEMLYSKYNSVYDAFVGMARDPDSVKNLGLAKGTAEAISEICSKIRLPSVQIRGMLELTCSKSSGLDVIKKVLTDAASKGGQQVQITYVGAPKYRIVLTSPDFKSAEKALKPIIGQIQKGIEKHKGTFAFTREESKKTREE